MSKRWLRKRKSTNSKIIQLIRQLGHWEKYEIEIVAECHDGEQALQNIIEKRPDFVLSDIKMPVYDGIQLIEKVREQRMDTLFVLLSGYRHFEYARSAIQLNVMDYLLKPIDEAQLNETLEKVCRKIDQLRGQKDANLRLEDWEKTRGEQELQAFWQVLIDKNPKEVAAFEKIKEEDCNRKYHTNFEKGCYQVLCTVSNLNGMLELDDSLFSEKVKGFIQNSFVELAHVQYHTTFQGHIIILNFAEENRTKIRNATSALFCNIRDLSEIYGDFRFHIGTSEVKNCCGQLVEAFTEANAAEWGRLIFLGSNVTDYGQLKKLTKFTKEEVITKEQMETLIV